MSLPGETSADNRGQRPVLLSDVAEVTMGTAEASSISRTNGKASLNVVVVKDPDANTVDVTSGVLDVVDSLEGLPPDIQVLVLSNDGPEVERSLSNLLREGSLGFLFAITAVFIFLINTRPTPAPGNSFYPAPHRDHRRIHPAKRLIRRPADELGQSLAELHESGRSSHRGRQGGG